MLFRETASEEMMKVEELAKQRAEEEEKRRQQVFLVWIQGSQFMFLPFLSV
jgi:hypothetical protein